MLTYNYKNVTDNDNENGNDNVFKQCGQTIRPQTKRRKKE
ncbi:hypothetical protein BRYFOR_05139 [Marvinbryantia formatexigens DSM 14469]|uniref:Uncharacterized protein n=1 Tax=Marvinbryantia formatexigens DSM 14469 TaxID=478749 RepID=C6L949_9FIRM|nr:hypothetical protein BRYFOR_05139 [Marvinbryantia formatexigens DSM 14469]